MCLTGVYQSLVVGWWVCRQDVDDAVNSFCEELAPIEIDMTNFILGSCRLTHQMLDVGTLRRSLQPSESASCSPSTVLSSCDDEHNIEDGSNKSDRSVGFVIGGRITVRVRGECLKFWNDARNTRLFRSMLNAYWGII